MSRLLQAQLCPAIQMFYNHEVRLLINGMKDIKIDCRNEQEKSEVRLYSIASVRLNTQAIAPALK